MEQNTYKFVLGISKVLVLQRIDGWGVYCQEEDWQMTLVAFKSRILVIFFFLRDAMFQVGEQWFAHPWMLYVVAVLACGMYGG